MVRMTDAARRERDAQILRLLREGRSYTDIAREVGCSRGTIAGVKNKMRTMAGQVALMGAALKDVPARVRTSTRTGKGTGTGTGTGSEDLKAMKRLAARARAMSSLELTVWVQKRIGSVRWRKARLELAYIRLSLGMSV